MEQKEKNFIFDIDGVIISTDELHYEAWKATAKEVGIDLERKINGQLRGVARAHSLEYILKYYNKEKEISLKRFEELLIFKNKLYLKSLQKLSKKDVFPGAEELLEKIHDKGYKISLGSASLNASFILKQIGLLKYFDSRVDVSSIRTAKSTGELFALVAKDIGINYKNCYVIEDAQSGIDGANVLGMHTICYQTEDHLHKCEYCVKNHYEIIKLLSNL